MGKSDSDDRRFEADLERDYLVLRAGFGVCGAKATLPPGYNAVYSGGGVHIGPSHSKRKRGQRLTLKFSFDRKAAGPNASKIFSALQAVLGGGEVKFDKDGNESWKSVARKTFRK